MPASVRVPCSTSNLGAGFDVVGLALDRYLKASFEPGGAELRLERAGTLAGLDLPPDRDLLVRAFRSHLETRGVAVPAGVIRAESEIPVGRGLGSSAAAVVAGLALAAAVAGDAEPDRCALLVEAERWEGHPDNVAPALLGGLVASAHDAAGSTHAMPHPVSEAVGFAFAAPGVVVPTSTARAALPVTVPHGAAIRSLGRLAALLRGLATADAALLAIGFSDELHVPYREPLIPGAAWALSAAREAGAWAATISGAGSGLIAVCEPRRAGEVAEAMGRAFAEAAGPEGVAWFAARPELEGTRIEGVRG